MLWEHRVSTEVLLWADGGTELLVIVDSCVLLTRSILTIGALRVLGGIQRSCGAWALIGCWGNKSFLKKKIFINFGNDWNCSLFLRIKTCTRMRKGKKINSLSFVNNCISQITIFYRTKKNKALLYFWWEISCRLGICWRWLVFAFLVLKNKISVEQAQYFYVKNACKAHNFAVFTAICCF